MRLKGKIAVITGAGRGIGRAIALRLAEEGAHVVAADIDQASAEDTANQIESLGAESLALKVDVCSGDQVKAMVAAAVNRFGRIDILVNNAGITIAKPVVEFEEAEWDRMIDVNLKGVLRCSQEAAKIMIDQNSGKIINIASESGKTGRPIFSIYGATKFAIVGFTQGLAMELAPYRINVNAVCPGIVDTEMWEELDRVLSKRENLPKGAALKKRIKKIPLGRLESPEDVAGLVAFLASSDADYMTGQAVNITGGREVH